MLLFFVFSGGGNGFNWSKAAAKFRRLTSTNCRCTAGAWRGLEELEGAGGGWRGWRSWEGLPTMFVISGISGLLVCMQLQIFDCLILLFVVFVCCANYMLCLSCPELC